MIISLGPPWPTTHRLQMLRQAQVLRRPLIGQLLLLRLRVSPQTTQLFSILRLDPIKRRLFLFPECPDFRFDLLHFLSPPASLLRFQLQFHSPQSPIRFLLVRSPSSVPFLQLFTALHQLGNRSFPGLRRRPLGGGGGQPPHRRRRRESQGYRRRRWSERGSGIGIRQPRWKQRRRRRILMVVMGVEITAAARRGHEKQRRRGRSHRRRLPAPFLHELLCESLQNLIVLPFLDRINRPILLLLLPLLLLLKNLPPLSEPLRRPARNFSGDLLPFIAVFGLQSDDQKLLLFRQRTLFNSGFEIIFPAFQTGLSVSVERGVHALRNISTPPSLPPCLCVCVNVPTCFSFTARLNQSQINSLRKVKELITTIGIPSIRTSPILSLQRGNWVKLICGASFEDVVDIRNLSVVYTLAGVDCIDCAADESVVSAVNEGIEAAREIVPLQKPWVMISVNDDEDLHFRKAEFDPNDCPLDCSRPCEFVCPANAISLEVTPSVFKGGVRTDRCYGCGRCFPVCPYDQIRSITYTRDAAAASELLKRNDVDAMEIHTTGRQTASFKEFWNNLGDSLSYLGLVAVSLPDTGDALLHAMSTMYSIMEPNLKCFNLWQLDGRPMSGDIGRGATREAIAFAVRLAAAEGRPPGFLQLAGGTNAHTVEGLKQKGLFQTRKIHESSKNEGSTSSALIGGIAYGGYARKIVGRVLNGMQSEDGHKHIEDHPEHLMMALIEALALVGTVKCFKNSVA